MVSIHGIYPLVFVEKTYTCQGFTIQGAGVGKGLGLSIAYNTIQKYNGRIQVESEVG